MNEKAQHICQESHICELEIVAQIFNVFFKVKCRTHGCESMFEIIDQEEGECYEEYIDKIETMKEEGELIIIGSEEVTKDPLYFRYRSTYETFLAYHN